jgi:drug/metabolite transporter (DMT)-like permease
VSWTAVALVLTAAVLHASWNLLVKKTDAHHFPLLSALAAVSVWAPLGGYVLARDLGTLDLRDWGALMLSSVLHLAYFLALLRGYRVSDLTVVYPVARGTGPLLASVAAMVVLRERPGWVPLAGAVGIPIGVFVLSGGTALFQRGATDPRVRAGLGWGVATGALIGAYTAVDGYSVKVLTLSPILVDYVGNVLRVPLLAPGALVDRARFVADCRATWRQALVVAVAGPVAYCLVLYAAQLAPLSRVAPLRETSMLFAAVFGGKILGEPDRGPRLIGAGLVALGVVALSAG